MILPIDKLTPGMEVAADVVNLNKVLLLGKGAVLTERHLRTLKMWGIEMVHVVGGDDPGTKLPTREELPPDVLREAEDRVRHRLRFVLVQSPAVTIIRDLAVRRVARRLTQERQSKKPVPPPRV